MSRTKMSLTGERELSLEAQRSLRLCVRRFTTAEEVDYAGEQLVKHVTRLRRTAVAA